MTIKLEAKADWTPISPTEIKISRISVGFLDITDAVKSSGQIGLIEAQIEAEVDIEEAYRRDQENTRNDAIYHRMKEEGFHNHTHKV